MAEEGHDGSDVPRVLPEGLQLGRQTPRFTVTTVPRALLAAHQTSVWAQLIVFAGSVRFVDEDVPWTAVAAPGDPVVIIPRQLHHIEPSDDAEFSVQFYDAPAD